MKITWLGHASFLIESGNHRIVTDPFAERVGYPIYTGKVDIVTVSHDHYDHNAVELLQGQPQVVNKSGNFLVDGVEISGLDTWHDKKQGNERGHNTIFKIMTEGLSILHLGDIGHVLPPELVASLGRVDILMVPVGGKYTVDAGEAYSIAEMINPKIIIPMHFQTPPCTIDLAPVEGFTMKYNRVIKLPYLLLEEGDLNNRSGVIILDYPG
ncbi:MAG: MBL fold metallo-hydrolase [Syntrophomonadaceae bacterium]|nr:MBL fold metallo-hydrolase [Syntrophomonadaceae bacterium]